MGFEWPWQRNAEGKTHFETVIGRSTATGGQAGVASAYAGTGIVIAPFYAIGELGNRSTGGQPGTFNVFEARKPKSVSGSYVSGETLAKPIALATGGPLAALPAVKNAGHGSRAPAEPTFATRLAGAPAFILEGILQPQDNRQAEFLRDPLGYGAPGTPNLNFDLRWPEFPDLDDVGKALLVAGLVVGGVIIASSYARGRGARAA